MADLREVLEAKYDEIDAGAPSEPVEAPESAPAPKVEEAAPEPKASPVEGRAREPDGKFAPEPKKTEPKKAAAAPAPAGAVATHAPIGLKPGEPAAPAQAVPPTVTKAPQALKPAARELWGKLPPEFEPLKAEWARRERETAIAMQRASEAQKGAAQIQELTRPYEAVIRQSGLDAPKYVENLLQTAYQLNTAAPQQRAAVLADIVMQFGVTPADLDQALVARIQGQPAPAQSQQQQQFRDPRFDVLMQQMQQAKQQRESAQAAESSQIVDSFKDSHEFAEDVQDEIADILEVWAKRGKTAVSPEDLERAYTIACQNNPDVAPLLEQRRAAEAAQKAIASTARSRSAASSVRSEPAAPLASQPADRRAVLEAKWDELNTR